MAKFLETDIRCIVLKAMNTRVARLWGESSFPNHTTIDRDEVMLYFDLKNPEA